MSPFGPKQTSKFKSVTSRPQSSSASRVTKLAGSGGLAMTLLVLLFGEFLIEFL
jgi:hypothetical protein